MRLLNEGLLEDSQMLVSVPDFRQGPKGFMILVPGLQ